MRMFAGLPLPAEVAADLDRFLEPRREASDRWRWTPQENWHVTLAFLGEVSNPERVMDALAGVVAAHRPLHLRLAGAGAFPDIARARHLYQAVTERGGGLAPLAEGVRAAAQHAGAPVDKERFVGHVTVGRADRPHDATHLWRALDTYLGPEWTATEVVLFRSHLGRGRGGAPAYQRWEAFPLG